MGMDFKTGMKKKIWKRMVGMVVQCVCVYSMSRNCTLKTG